jgi:aarF domain-containing kinase
LPLEFRENYAKFWMSIIHANVQEMQEHSEKLGVKELYSYFACMVAGRSMTSVLGGKVKKTKTSEEEKQIKVDASVYLVSDKFSVAKNLFILYFIFLISFY